MIERKKDKGIGTFVIQIGQPERGDIHFPCLLSAVTQGFKKIDGLLTIFTIWVFSRSLSS